MIWLFIFVHWRWRFQLLGYSCFHIKAAAIIQDTFPHFINWICDHPYMVLCGQDTSILGHMTHHTPQSHGTGCPIAVHPKHSEGLVFPPPLVWITVYVNVAFTTPKLCSLLHLITYTHTVDYFLKACLCSDNGISMHPLYHPSAERNWPV